MSRLTIQRATPRSVYRNGFLLTALILIFVLSTEHPFSSNTVSSSVFHKAPPSSSYDLPALLGVSSLSYPLGSSMQQINIQPKLEQISKSFPHCIAALYHAIPSVCAVKPFRPHIHLALQRYAAFRRHTFNKFIDQVSNSDQALLLHVVHTAPDPTNSTSLSQLFLHHAAVRATYFQSIIVLSSTDSKASHQSVQKDLELLQTAIGRPVSVQSTQGADEDVYFMSIAKHLMVHRGPMSALGALACRGTVYYTPDLADYMEQNAFRWQFNAKRAMQVQEFLPNSLLNSIGTVSPSCCRLEPYGVGDGEKIVCANAQQFSRVRDERCWIASVGCGNQWHFEDDVVARTKCHVHTFDCTRDYVLPERLKGRVTLHKLCLGKENDERPLFVSWKEILDIGESNSGGKVARQPVVAKMDIEGHEFAVLQELVQQHVDGSQLPEQLLVEIHTFAGVEGVGAPFVKEDRFVHPIANERVMDGLFRSLSDAGYSLVHRADNPYCVKCSEVTLVQRAGLPRVS